MLISLPNVTAGFVQRPRLWGGRERFNDSKLTPPAAPVQRLAQVSHYRGEVFFRS
jgi:hypothetical protein